MKIASFIVVILIVTLVFAVVLAMIAASQIGMNSFKFFQNKKTKVNS